MIGWPTAAAAVPAAPSTISGLANIRILYDAVTAGVCYWTQMTSGETSEHLHTVGMRRMQGEEVGVARKVRSDKGGVHKRKRDESRDPDEGEQSDDGERSETPEVIQQPREK